MPGNIRGFLDRMRDRVDFGDVRPLSETAAAARRHSHRERR